MTNTHTHTHTHTHTVEVVMDEQSSSSRCDFTFCLLLEKIDPVLSSTYLPRGKWAFFPPHAPLWSLQGALCRQHDELLVKEKLFPTGLHNRHFTIEEVIIMLTKMGKKPRTKDFQQYR